MFQIKSSNVLIHHFAMILAICTRVAGIGNLVEICKLGTILLSSQKEIICSFSNEIFARVLYLKWIMDRWIMDHGSWIGGSWIMDQWIMDHRSVDRGSWINGSWIWHARTKKFCFSTKFRFLHYMTLHDSKHM